MDCLDCLDCMDGWIVSIDPDCCVFVFRRGTTVCCQRPAAAGGAAVSLPAFNATDWSQGITGGATGAAPPGKQVATGHGGAGGARMLGVARYWLLQAPARC